MPRLLSFFAAAVLALALAVAPASAQVRVPPVGGDPSPTPTATSTPRPTPSPTYRLPEPDPEPEPEEEPQPQPTATRSTKPPSTSGGSSGTNRTPTSTSGSSSGSKRAPSSSTGSSSTSPRVAGPSTSPFIARSIEAWTSREKTPAHTTTRLLELIDAAQPNGEEASLRERAIGFGRFPVVGYVWYQDDFGAPRWFPSYHPHLGTDLFAKSGTPVIASADGTVVRWNTGGGGGNALWLMGDDGVRYYYGHMRSFAPGVNTNGRRLRTGDIIGTVGATGQSAVGTYPHVHFEINIGGREVNPKPILDAWLKRAEEQAAIAAGLHVGPDSFSPSRPSRWVSPLDLVGDATPAGPAPIWTSALGGSATATFAELALTELMARDDLTVTAKGADGPQFDPLALLLAPAGEDEHEHAD